MFTAIVSHSALGIGLYLFYSSKQEKQMIGHWLQRNDDHLSGEKKAAIFLSARANHA